MAAKDFDLVVIGAGPAGYTGAIRAAQLGMQVACVEREPKLGGTCLRIGCIPSKALLESSHLLAAARDGFAAHGITGGGGVGLDLPQMLRRKDEVVGTLTTGIEGLFRKNRVERLAGTASLAARDGEFWPIAIDGQVAARARRVLVASGSREALLAGVEVDGDRVGTSTQALNYPEVPRRLVVIGAGAIGLELGSVWRRLGSEVTVLEYAERILPGMDGELAAQAQRQFARQGLNFRLGSRVLGARRKGDACVVEVADQPPLEADRVLMCTGRIPNTEGLEVERAGIALDPRGRIPVDKHWATVAPGIFAVGDVVPGPMLAHKAEEEAVACVERMAGVAGHVDYDTVPLVVYTMPEVAAVGRSEEALKAAGIAYKAGRFPFAANARARAHGDTTGFVKILACAQTDRILGVHILGTQASEHIAEATCAMAFGASSEDVARTCHAHPTQAEALREAALSVAGRALNI